jgi:hypothetical protein
LLQQSPPRTRESLHAASLRLPGGGSPLANAGGAKHIRQETDCVFSITRQRALYYVGALLLQGCGASSPGAVRVGSTNSGQNQTIAEIYALALERAKIRVERRMRFGDKEQLLNGAERNEIAACGVTGEYRPLRGNFPIRSGAIVAAQPLEMCGACAAAASGRYK